ncbi:MAG: glycosyltransferase, partial [Bacteroidota bacterium]
IWNIKNPLFYFVYKFFKWKEVQLFSSADTTISLTEAAKEEIHSWDLPSQPIPIHVIPCCVDTELFSSEAIEPKHMEEKRKNLGIQNGQLVISYLGSIGTWYLLAEMMDFFSKLLKTYPKALFLFITKSDPVAISEMAALKGIDPTNLSIVEASRKEVPYYLALSQLNVFFYKPTFSRKATSPTKQGEVMSLGIPIICNDKVGDTGSIIRETQSGIVLDSFEDSSYQQVIDSIGTLLEIPSERIRKGALTYFSLDMGIQKYHTAYQSLLA